MNSNAFLPTQQLREASSAGVIADPTDVSIANSGYSELFNIEDCTDFVIGINALAGNASGDVLVEKGDDASFTNVITHATIAINGVRTATWNNGGPDFGPMRIKNTSGRAINVFLKKRIT